LTRLSARTGRWRVAIPWFRNQPDQHHDDQYNEKQFAAPEEDVESGEEETIHSRSSFLRLKREVVEPCSLIRSKCGVRSVVEDEFEIAWRRLEEEQEDPPRNPAVLALRHSSICATCLTVTAGVRWSHGPPVYEADGNRATSSFTLNQRSEGLVRRTPIFLWTEAAYRTLTP
jgi:hypothetical protein